jgi:hypothetical protein
MSDVRDPELAIVAVAGLALTACSLTEGPPGTVVTRHQEWSSATKAYTYSPTVRAKDGQQTTFQVYVGAYDRCRPSAAYPACTKEARQ